MSKTIEGGDAIVNGYRLPSTDNSGIDSLGTQQVDYRRIRSASKTQKLYCFCLHMIRLSSLKEEKHHYRSPPRHPSDSNTSVSRTKSVESLISS
jgi:hypothetical protein